MISKRLFADYFDTIDELLDASGKVAIVFDVRRFIIHYVNNQFVNFFGVRKDDAIENYLFEYISLSKDEMIDIVVDIIHKHRFKNQIIVVNQKKVKAEIIKLSVPSSSDDYFALFFEPVEDKDISNSHFENVVRREGDIISSFINAYKKVYYINLKSKKYVRLTEEVLDSNNLNLNKTITGSFFEKVGAYVSDEDKDRIFEFLNIDTLRKRLKKQNKINEEFESKLDGWVRIGFIVCRRDSLDEVEDVLFTFRIINETKRKEIELRNEFKEALDDSKQKSNAKSAFLSKIGGDIISPLNSIIGMASLAKTNVNDVNNLNNALTKIIESSQKLTKTFTEIIDMAKVETGNINFAREEISIPELFTNVINSNRNDILERKHWITVKCSNVKHEFIFGDKMKLQQILNNVLDNAIKYTQDNGSITMMISERESYENDKFSEYIFTIQDNGIGMSEDFLNIVYEPFERENRPQVLSTNGEGLGLSLASSYIQKLGGKINISSEIAMGTKVTITLPFEICDKEYPCFEKTNEIKVLLISDNKAQLNDVLNNFNMMNIQASIANNTRSAVMQLKDAMKKSTPFDYILCTWQTPSMSGVETIKKIRSMIDFELPKVAFAHYELEKIKDEANKVGVNTFIHLPLFKSRIHEVLNSFVGIDNASSIEQLKRKRNGELKGKRVLIVEDNDLNREILNDFLQMYGINVYEACDGKQAVEIFDESEEFFYDLILMDIQMPVMNGYEATMSIRSMDREDGKQIPIIAMSASSFAEDINSSILAGMNEHIGKPLNFTLLHEMIEKWFVGEYAKRKNLELRLKSDSFTNVLNKVATFESIHKYLSQPQVPLSAMMIIDLDNFKNVNDNYGHNVGDGVIVETTKILSECFRGDDIIGRFGGDEFIVFMKNICKMEVAIERANRVNSSIDNHFDGRFAGFKVTTCVGIAFVNKPVDEQRLFIQADHALYRAKKNGKNQVVYVDTSCDI